MSRSQSPSKDALCRIVLLGDQGVGKSSYVSTLFDEDFQQNYNPTIGVDYRAKHIAFSNKSARVHIFDSSGHPELKNISKSLYEYAEGFVFMYSVEDRESFGSIKEWIETVNTERKLGSCTILLGNKKDTVDRQVSEEEGRAFAVSQDMHFYETSAKAMLDVSESMSCLVRRIDKIQEDMRPKDKKQKKDISYTPLACFLLLLVASLLF